MRSSLSQGMLYDTYVHMCIHTYVCIIKHHMSIHLYIGDWDFLLPANSNMPIFMRIPFLGHTLPQTPYIHVHTSVNTTNPIRTPAMFWCRFIVKMVMIWPGFGVPDSVCAHTPCCCVHAEKLYWFQSPAHTSQDDSIPNMCSWVYFIFILCSYICVYALS